MIAVAAPPEEHDPRPLYVLVLEAAIKRVIAEYEATHLMHDVAYEDLARALDELSTVVRD